MSIKNDIENIFCEKNVYTLLLRGKDYIDELLTKENLPIDLYFDLTYYCLDFFLKGFELDIINDKFYYSKYFGDKMEYFCNKYIELKGINVFNNKKDVDFLIEIAVIYELANKFDEKFILLDLIVNNSNCKELKLKAIDAILDIGDIGEYNRNKYEKLRDNILNTREDLTEERL